MKNADCGLEYGGKHSLRVMDFSKEQGGLCIKLDFIKTRMRGCPLQHRSIRHTAEINTDTKHLLAPLY